MHDFPTETLRLLRQGAPQVFRAVDMAHAKSGRTRRTVRLSLTLDAFEDNPMLLYAAVWYASREGVSVTFVPWNPGADAASPLFPSGRKRRSA